MRHLSPIPPVPPPFMHKTHPAPTTDYGALCGFSGYKNRHKSAASECLSNSANSTSIKVTNCSFVSFIFSREKLRSTPPLPHTHVVGFPLVLSHHVTICSRGGNFAPENTTRTVRKSCEKERPTSAWAILFFRALLFCLSRKGREFAVSFYNLARRILLCCEVDDFPANTKATLLCEKFSFCLWTRITLVLK